MEKKKAVIYSTVALIALVILVVGATYAYFQNQYGSASNADVNVTTYTTDVLTFETGDAINITADQESFAQGKGNRTGSTFSRATLQANNKTNTATANYYVYLNISGNDFEYSKDSSSPELLLSITDNSGNQVTKLTGLNYITVTDGSNKSVSGFDITKSSGLLTLIDNKEISASPKKIEEWNITITLVNYNYDQNANTGKSFSGKLMIQKDEYILTATDVCSGKSLSDCVIAQYTGIKNSNIYYHDSNLTNGAGDSSYRYAGADVKNYICLGSSEATCPDDNLYRIIGVFGDNNHGIKDQQLVKVIKNTSIGNIKWNKSNSNVWANASLNTTLNSTFKTEKLSGFEDKIAEVSWRVSGYSTSAATVKTVYTAEITNATKTHTAKIGLMYPSDYEYATTPDYWTTNLFDYDTAAKNKDWLFLGSYEWLLSPGSGDFNGAWNVNSSGRAYNNGGVVYASAVRPSFYLLSSVKYVSGSGTSSLPIRIN
ncbi:unknown [Clostridium sp. CAG:609]|nr:unknown [Clostridium sp. CAG:609]